MILPDVNVLVYAFRCDVPQHDVSRQWLDAVVSREARFGLSPLTLSAVVRITTGLRQFQTSSSLEDAFGFCNDLLDLPHCHLVTPGERHWEIFTRLCRDTNTRGRRVTDAWFAALAIEWGCEWITFDRDFARFPGLSYNLLVAPTI